MERELDREVAERVFGHTVVVDEVNARGISIGVAGPHGRDVPHYSTRIEDAWLVVEVMKNGRFSTRHFFVEAIRTEMLGKRNGFLNEIEPAWWVFFLTPEMICRAAIEAVAGSGDVRS